MKAFSAKPLRLPLVLLSYCFFMFTPPSQAQNLDCTLASSLYKLFSETHIEPLMLSDDFSEEIYWGLLEKLDSRRTLFHAEALAPLEVFKRRIDDEIDTYSCTFVKQVALIYRQQLEASLETLKKLKDIPLDFKRKDSVQLDWNTTWAPFPSLEAWETRWEQLFAYEALKLINNELGYDSTFSESLNTQEEDIRARTYDKLSCQLQKLNNSPEEIEAFITYQYLNVISNRFDPHSSFFTTYEKESFESSLSLVTDSFGIFFTENDEGEIEVARLSPGGAAWQSNEIHKGDILIRIAAPDGPSVGFDCAQLSSIYKFLGSKEAEILNLTLRNKSGQVKTVQLAREKLEVDDNRIKSFVLDSEAPVGYLNLPGFYTEWDDSEARGCAEDVAREIVKMKREKIQALILDLRFNGGGSMREALSLAGIFIDEGALCLSDSREEGTVSLKDRNRGTIYDGPLIVMVNRLSASASEILAGILQDYHRGVIIGQTTYGKASGQIILPLYNEGSPSLYSSDSPIQGFVKVTTNRYYRLDGTSHQLRGIDPDIDIPDMVPLNAYGEAFEPFPLEYKILQKTVDHPRQDVPLGELSQLSKERTKADSLFTKISELQKLLGEVWDLPTRIPLHMQDFLSDYNAEGYWPFDESLQRISQKFTVRNNEYDQELYEINNYTSLINENNISKIQADIYIQEAFHIAQDLIRLQKK